MGLFSGDRRRQTIRENLSGFLGVGVLHLELFLSTKNERPMLEIAVEKLLEGSHFGIIGREIFITP